jgi:hypothetical protein
MKELLNIGFIKIGQWVLSDGVIKVDITSNSKEKNLLYCFVLDNKIKYIGKTTRTISERLNGYLNPNESQRTNVRINQKIHKVLKKGVNIDIYIFSHNGLLKYGNFEINLAAGLEDSLIKELQPKWNKNGKTEDSFKKDKVITPKSKRETLIINNKITPDRKFNIIIGQAYYYQGFFNVGVKNSSFFGEHGERIRIQLGNNSNSITIGKINRTANNNGTPRIMAGGEYKNWIQKNFRLGDIFKVEIISPGIIQLSK